TCPTVTAPLQAETPVKECCFTPATSVTERPVYVQSVGLPTSVNVPLFEKPDTSSTSRVSFAPDRFFATRTLVVSVETVAVRLTELPETFADPASTQRPSWLGLSGLASMSTVARYCLPSIGSTTMSPAS